jgi:hypothetical protein
MKKFLLTFTTTAVMATSVFSQDPNFDKKFRFGLRVSGQPSWYTSGEKSNVPSGAKFGYGFGLNLEFRFSDVAGFLTGVGGDFEGGKYKFKQDKANNYESMYWMDENNDFVKANSENRTKPKNTAFVLKERTLKTTYVSIPLILKLSTKEYNGLKYSGMFGGELGIRVKATATDSYFEARKYINDSAYVNVPVESPLSGINVGKESSLLPFRFGLNAGIGAEYRLGGSTAAFININYFRSFTSQLKKESEYIVYKTEPGANNSTPIKQNLKLSAIRITVGIMF